MAGRLHIDQATLNELVDDLGEREVWDGNLLSFTRSLRPRARTGIVSNTWPEMRVRMAKHGLIDVVDELVLSCEVGVAKPGPRIFEIALERLGLAPADVLFVDDSPANVGAAEKLGINSHHYVSRPVAVAAITAFLASDG